MSSTAVPRYTRSTHLVDLVAEAERLAALVEAADERARAGLRRRWSEDAAVASLVLDGSPLREAPDVTGVEAELDRAGVQTGTGAGWFDTLRSGQLDAGDHDADLEALEYLGVQAALASDDLVPELLMAPTDVMTELHRRLTRGLLAEPGTPRRTAQAVHDGSTGRVIYLVPDPVRIPSELAELDAFVQGPGAREHAVVLSGIVHHELLRIHPYEAANGRLARVVGRLILRARGLDPDGLAVTEVLLARDPLGYHEELAASLRRRDLTIWLERWGEAVAGGLRAAALELDVLEVEVPDRAGSFLADRADAGFTVADYRAEVAVGPQEARADLGVLLDAGRIERVLGTRGLRFEVTGGAGRR